MGIKIYLTVETFQVDDRAFIHHFQVHSTLSNDQ